MSPGFEYFNHTNNSWSDLQESTLKESLQTQSGNNTTKANPNLPILIGSHARYLLKALNDHSDQKCMEI